MARVVLKNVFKTFLSKKGTKEAVRDVSFTCEDKEFMILVGPSGCGKSTTLRMIAGLEEITRGEIYIGDRLVNDIAPRDRDIAMVFQNYALYPHLSAYDNMAFGLRLHGIKPAEITRRVAEAAQILKISDLLQALPRNLSGGQRQRVAVGRAIVRKPKVFLFDEPLSNLDAEMRESMRAELRNLHHILDATMIYVTHDQVEAMTMADRIAVMHEGELHQFATPNELYHAPRNRFVAGFIGNQRMNFIDGGLRKKGRDWFFFNSNLELKLHPAHAKKLSRRPDAPVTLGIRPENIYDKVYSKNATAGNTLRSRIKVMLPTGDYAILHMLVNKQKLTMKVSAYERLADGQKIDIVLDMSKAMYFEPKPEKADVCESTLGLCKRIC
jgi:multiple sugar transport system ATP-binding protein